MSGVASGVRFRDVHPAQDGAERIAQLMREGGQKLILDPVEALGFVARSSFPGQQVLVVGFSAVTFRCVGRRHDPSTIGALRDDPPLEGCIAFAGQHRQCAFPFPFGSQ